jgi:multidrug efflux pump subunit AcrA (membrane-fusion protein)
MWQVNSAELTMSMPPSFNMKIYNLLIVCLLGFTVSPTIFSQTYLPAKTIKLKRQNYYQRQLTFLGKTTVEKTSIVGFEIAGLVKKILVHDGDKVKKGQPLAMLDQEKLLQQKERLIAQAKSIQANLTLSKLNFNHQPRNT